MKILYRFTVFRTITFSGGTLSYLPLIFILNNNLLEILILAFPISAVLSQLTAERFQSLYIGYPTNKSCILISFQKMYTWWQQVVTGPNKPPENKWRARVEHSFEMLCAIWHNFYNSKNVKNIHGGVQL